MSEGFKYRVGRRWAWLATAAVLVAGAAQAQATQVPPIQFKERTLPNGMKVFASRDTTTLASVRSMCAACRGNASSSTAIRAQASFAADSSR